MSVFVKGQILIAQMVELVDTLVSGTSGRKVVGVRVPLWVRIIFQVINPLIDNCLQAQMVELVDTLL